MQFQIEIIHVATTVKPTKKGSYTQLDVAYKRVDTGKVEGKKVLSFTNKEVFDTLKDAKQGMVYTITSEKNDDTGYWDWTNTTQDNNSTNTQAVGAPSKGNPTPKSTYETPEERAKRQVLIVRQSSLSNAIQTLAVNPGKDKIQPEDVLKLADIYFDWVMENNPKSKSKDIGFDDMNDNIPL